MAGQHVRHRWRDYRTASGGQPVQAFIGSLSDREAAEVLVAMSEVKERGLVAARHLRGDVYEVRAWGDGRTIRILFAHEGAKGRILLALHGFVKQTTKTPDHALRLAERRLRDWRTRPLC